MTRARTIDEWLDEYCVSRHSLDAQRRLAAVAGIRREAIADFLASPRAEQRLAVILSNLGFVRGVAGRYGRFNVAYWDESSRAILAALRGSEQ